MSKKLFLNLISCFFLFIQLNAQYEMEPLSVGEKATPIQGIDQNEKFVNSSQILEEAENILLIFYRGSWCPYCKKHLSQLQDSLQLVLDLNTSVIVVTPEEGPSIEKMIGKTGATFSIIHDKEYQIMNNFGVSFHLNKETVPSFYKFVLNNTRKANGNEEDILPVPATFIIGKDGLIKYVHYEQDYKIRSNISEIIKILEN